MYFTYYKNLRVLSFVFALLMPLLVWAQDELEEDLLTFYGDDDLVTIATGTEKHVRLAPSVASVITKEEIKASGARFLTDVLKSVPGIHVGNGLLFNDEQISIRGIQTSNNPHVLVLIDGIAIRNLFTAGRPSGWRMPTENIERVEVIRGPGSAVYGADAFAGVINIITKSAMQIGEAVASGEVHSAERVGGRVGSFDTQDAWFQKGYANDRVSVSLNHEYSKTDGDDERMITDGFGQRGVFRTEYEINNTALKVSVDDLTLSYRRWELSNGGNGAGGAQVLDPQGGVEYVTNQYNLGYKSTFNDHWMLEVNAGYGEEHGDIDNVLLPVGVYPIDDGSVNPGNIGNLNPAGILVSFPEGAIGNPTTDSSITHFDFALTNDSLNGHVIRAAAGYRYEDFDTSETKNFGPGVLDPNVITTAPPVTNVSNTPNVFIPDVNREVQYLSLQDEWQFANDWSLTLGVRYDNYSDVGDTFNPRAALVWAVDYNLTAKLLYGRAFRAPSFSELFSQNNPSQIGNANLDPEVIDVYEMAFDYQFNHRINTQLNLFYYEIDGLVDFTPSAQGLLAQNALDQEGYGAELAASWTILADLYWHGNISLHRIKNSRTKLNVADVPTRQIFSSFVWRPISQASFSFETKWLSGRDRAFGDARKKVSGYAISNLVSSLKCRKTGLDMSIIVKNIFDKDAVEPEKFRAPSFFVSSDYPIEGRSIFLEIGYDLPI